MRVRTVVAILLGVVVTATPAGLADSISREMTPQAATPAVHYTHVYSIDVDEGEQVTAELSWDDARADLDLAYDNPQDDCSDIECNVFFLLDADEPHFRNRVIDTFTCQRGSHGDVGLGPATETETLPTGPARSMEIMVSSRAGVPDEPIDYTLTIESDDDPPPNLGWPDEVITVSTTSHCREAV